MAVSAAYIDTSALVKWYVPEPGSEEVVEYLRQSCPAFISLLTKVEMWSTINRHSRSGRLDAEMKSRILATFEGDIVAGYLQLVPLTVEAFLTAESLLGAHSDVPLTTLDALHLGTLAASGLSELATADRVMAEAAGRAHISCRLFAL